ncbi:MAG: calcium-binding protein [Sulfitobacter sp.]
MAVPSSQSTTGSAGRTEPEEHARLSRQITQDEQHIFFERVGPHEISWSVPVVGSQDHMAVWTLYELRPDTWSIRDVRVTHLGQSEQDIVLSYSDSVWETASQLTLSPETVDLSIDNFIGLPHGGNKQDSRGSTIHLDGGNTASASPQATDRGFVGQTHDFWLDGSTQEVVGSYSVHHVFEEDRLRLVTSWDFDTVHPVFQRTTYGVMIPVTTSTNGGLSQVEFSNKPIYEAQNNGDIIYASERHTPNEIVFSDPDHPFQLVASLPTGAPGRIAGGSLGTWEFADVEHAFIHDTQVTASNANGIVKAYFAFSSGVWREAISSEHITDFQVRYNPATALPAESAPYPTEQTCDLSQIVLLESDTTVETSLASYSLDQGMHHLVYSGSSDFYATGNEFDNCIIGGVGDDTLTGLAGDDTFFGGEGNNSLLGGLGADVVRYTDAPSGVIAKLSANAVQWNGFGGTDQLNSIENILGSQHADLLIGNDAENRLYGDGGRDTLIGLGGNDTLVGGANAADVLQGGPGDDTYEVWSKGDTLIEVPDEGTDTIVSYVSSFRLKENFEKLVSRSLAEFVGIGNSQDNTLVGGLGRDNLFGLGGDDILIGGADAANTLVGGAGNDTYRVSSIGDSLIELPAEGVDSVVTDLDRYSLRENIENLQYVGVNDFIGFGNRLDNNLSGSIGNDVLSGGGGSDTFLFTREFGDDSILDFDTAANGDKLQIRPAGELGAEFEHIDYQVSSDADGNAVLHVHNSSITLIGVEATAISGEFLV